MAEYIDEINMNHARLSANIFSVKEEECQDDSFVEDKVCISDATITIDNAELQGPIWYGKIKQYEESTCLNNITTELTSFEETDVENDKVKVEGGINADDIKIEIDNGLLYCEHCEAYYIDYCIECGMLVHILNKYALNNADSGEDIPIDILEIQDCLGQTGVYALRIIPAGVRFGPFTGLTASAYPWEMNGEKFVLDKNKWKCLNWMQYVVPTRNICDRNLNVFKSEGSIYYQSTRQIRAGEELLVYFDGEYEISPNKIVKVDFVTTTKDIAKDVFACTFCCLGFSSKSHLAKHKTKCVKDSAETFSVEELKQCPFCQIHLDPKEYLVYHMSFCCKRNARKDVLPTPPRAKQAATALNRRKRCLRSIYKCEQCKYSTKYQASLKEHTNNHHHKFKMYKCGICNGRFKTKKSLSLHVQNAHAFVGEKADPDQEHSTSDYMNTHINVEQSTARYQKKIFKCTLCMFRVTQKQSLRTHMKSKHLKQFDFNCDKCEFSTNYKTTIKRHIKNKHLNQFDYKCDKCEFETNNKINLKSHIKNIHLKQFDYNCDSCEYITNRKSYLERHIKNKHLKQFDYKCDKCDFGTNMKYYLGPVFPTPVEVSG